MQGQRFYDSHRFHILTRGWDLLATHSPIPSCFCGNLPEHVVKNGAPYCCPGNITFKERIATWNGSSFWDPPLDGIDWGRPEGTLDKPAAIRPPSDTAQSELGARNRATRDNLVFRKSPFRLQNLC